MLIWGFVRWQRHRERTGSDPLVHLDLRQDPDAAGRPRRPVLARTSSSWACSSRSPCTSSSSSGSTPCETGIKMLPVSIAMFVAAAAGPACRPGTACARSRRPAWRSSACRCVLLLATIRPDLADAAFALSMAVLGVGMGFMASQLGLVVQSSVDASGRGEAGGLQYTGQQLGSSLGVALIGAIVLSGLTSNFLSTVSRTTAISAEVAAQVGRRGDRHRLRLVDRRRGGRAGGGLDAATTAARRRGLRDGPAPGAQGRAAGGGPPRARLARVHPEPAGPAQAAEGESEARSSPEEPATAAA